MKSSNLVKDVQQMYNVVFSLRLRNSFMFLVTCCKNTTYEIEYFSVNAKKKLYFASATYYVRSNRSLLCFKRAERIEKMSIASKPCFVVVKTKTMYNVIPFSKWMEDWTFLFPVQLRVIQ